MPLPLRALWSESFFNISYFIVISIIKVFYGIHKLCSSDLNVIPLDRFASFTSKLLYCLKIKGSYPGSTGISLASSSIVADTIL